MKKQFLIVLLLITGCANSGGLFGETVGEKFRKALANVDAFCKKNKMGPYLDRSDYQSARNAGATDCEVLKIKPFDLNAVLATPEGKFAYSIQLPPPLDKPRVKRADYRSTEEYFEALCEIEAKDFVFKTVEGVNGVAQLRPSPAKFAYTLSSYSEEFVGGGDIAHVSTPAINLVIPQSKRYRFLEVVQSYREDQTPLQIRKFYQNVGGKDAYPLMGVSSEQARKLSVRYGYLWRGTPFLNSRDEGIVGGELIILDMQSLEVLAVRRVFGRDDIDLQYTDRIRLSGKNCRPRKLDGFPFIAQVLQPIATQEVK